MPGRGETSLTVTPCADVSATAAAFSVFAVGPPALRPGDNLYPPNFLTSCWAPEGDHRRFKHQRLRTLTGQQSAGLAALHKSIMLPG